MKKTYMSPSIDMMTLGTESVILAGSVQNSIDSNKDTQTVGVSNEEADEFGGNRNTDLWDDEEDY